MPPRLAGHALQLLGHALVFLGLAAAAAALFAAGNHPTVPTWAFAAVGVAVGTPVMIAGGRINNRGRALVLGLTPARAAREYRLQVVLLALYIAFLWLHGAWVAAPLFVRGTGLADPADSFVSVWVVAWMLLFCAGRDWITRPVWGAIERRVLARRGQP
jgi:hypothetical protein